MLVELLCCINRFSSKWGNILNLKWCYTIQHDIRIFKDGSLLSSWAHVQSLTKLDLDVNVRCTQWGWHLIYNILVQYKVDWFQNSMNTVSISTLLANCCLKIDKNRTQKCWTQRIVKDIWPLQSSHFLGRPLKHDEISKLYLKLFTSLSNFCGLLRIGTYIRCSRVVTDSLPYPKFSKSLLSC